MKKNTVLFVVLFAVLSLGLTLVPHVSSQAENIKVLSYSWYLDSLGNLIVVGEVQNVGNRTINVVYLKGTVYTTDGQAQATLTTPVFVYYLIPQQKAPFYLEFNEQNSNTGDLSWLSLGVDHVDFKVQQANVTTSYQYQDLKLRDTSTEIDANGAFWVRGTIQNTGNQTAKNIRVIGTFYNSSGTVVAVSSSAEPLTPPSVAPSEILSFKVPAWDRNQNEVPSGDKISSYQLLIQTEEPLLTGTPPPPIDTTPNNPPDSTPWATYAIVAVIVILVSVGAIIALRRRKSKALKRRKSQANRKQKLQKA